MTLLLGLDVTLLQLRSCQQTPQLGIYLSTLPIPSGHPSMQVLRVHGRDSRSECSRTLPNYFACSAFWAACNSRVAETNRVSAKFSTPPHLASFCLDKQLCYSRSITLLTNLCNVENSRLFNDQCSLNMLNRGSRGSKRSKKDRENN
eukprot:2650648-Amphidinium_carterae.1